MDKAGTQINQTVWKSLRRTVIMAVCLFIADAVVFGWFVIAVLTLPAIVTWHIPRTLLALKRRNSLIVRALKTGIYALMAAAIFAACAGNEYLARSRADTIASALQRYKVDHHRYPDSLRQLAPKYIPAVPRAKYRLVSGKFGYFSGSEPLFMYWGFPIFDLRVYDFGSNTWHGLD